MLKENVMFLNNQSYMSLKAIASAMCLDSYTLEDLVMINDWKDTVEIVNDEVMIPFDVFKRIKLPQDCHFFKIAAAYLKSEAVNRKRGDNNGKHRKQKGNTNRS